MSGHSKWSTIKHKKAAEDAKRGKVFSELSKQITVATREGGSGDPAQNPGLRTVLEKARAANMPKDNIKRAVDKGLGVGAAGRLEEVVYEGFGPGGVGVMVVVTTDNRNRTGAEIRFLFEKHQGSLGGPGSTAYMFERKGMEIEVKVAMPLTNPDDKRKVDRMVEDLSQHDDVEVVKTNVG